MDERIKSLVAQTNLSSYEWRKQMIMMIQEACRRAVASGATVYFLDPLQIKYTDFVSFDLKFHEQCLPVVITENIFTFADIIEKLFDEGDVFGLKRHRTFHVRGSTFTYLFAPILQLFALRGDLSIDVGSGQRDRTDRKGRTDRKDRTDRKGRTDQPQKSSQVLRISMKYLLPLLYRQMDEEDEVSEVFFLAEQQCIKLLDDSHHLGFGGNLSDVEMNARSIILKMLSKESLSDSEPDRFVATGVTAAMLETGGGVLLPIEIAAYSVIETGKVIENALKAASATVETRSFTVGHPSGLWYLDVIQVLCEGRLMAMIYNNYRFMLSTARYIKAASLRSSQLGTEGIWVSSPFMTMYNLCMAAWLLERKSIQRFAGVYSLLVKYRNAVMLDRLKHDKAEVMGIKDAWMRGYFHKELTPDEK